MNLRNHYYIIISVVTNVRPLDYLNMFRLLFSKTNFKTSKCIKMTGAANREIILVSWFWLQPT